MSHRNTFRVAVVGHPSTEQWLLAAAFAATRKRDPLGVIPAAFFVKVPPRAKCAVIVSRPITSGRIVDSLDQISRRFLGETTATTMVAAL